MTLATRDAQVVWEGTLGGGQGTLHTGGGAAQAMPMDRAARSEQAEGTTSPEELLAAAHAGCYAMALALALTRRGTPAERLAVSAVCALDRVEGEHEYAITGLRLEVRGHVPDIEGADFEALARHADEQCPVSNAVRGNVEVTLDARLDDAA